MLKKEVKAKLVKEYGGKDSNTGSVASQIAILTYDITSLTAHVQVAKKDNSSKLGLYKKVSQRKKLLSYLKKKDINAYHELVKKLNIRTI